MTSIQRDLDNTIQTSLIFLYFTVVHFPATSQLAEFRKLMDEGGMILQNNFRQPQPLNGREVRACE